MSDSKTLAEAIGEQTGLNVIDVASAPFIFFEEAPALGHINGLIRITLSAERVQLANGALVSEQVVTAYLRTNVQGALSLINALQSAVLLARPVEQTETGKAN